MADNITSEDIQGIVSDNINSAIAPINEKINALSSVVTSLYATMDRIANSLSLISDNLTLLQGGVDKVEAYSKYSYELNVETLRLGIQQSNFSVDVMNTTIRAIDGNGESILNNLREAFTAISSNPDSNTGKTIIEIDSTNIIDAISAGNDSIIGAINAINIPEPTNITPVLEAISSIDIPESTDIQPILTAINAINIPESVDVTPILTAISNISIPEPTDIQPVLTAINAINIPGATDISPIMSAIGAISIPEPTDITPILNAISAIPIPEVVDISPILNAINSINIEPVQDVVIDLSGVNSAIASSESSIINAINAIAIPPATDVANLETAVSGLSSELLSIPDKIKAILPTPQIVEVTQEIFDDSKIINAINNSLVEYSKINVNSQDSDNLTFAIAEVNSNVMEVKSILEEMADEMDLDVDDLSV